MGRYVTFTAWLPTPSTTNSLISGFTATIANTQTVINEIARAESFIDSFIGKMYAPLDYATSPTVLMLGEDITTYRIYSNYIYNRPEGISSDALTQLIQTRYNVSLNMLADLRDGKLELYDTLGNFIQKKNQSSVFYISTANYQPTFAEDGELSWGLSKNKIDDLRTNRIND